MIEIEMEDEMEAMKLETRRQPGQQSEDEAQEYLTNLQCLSSELQRAMEAIVSQELPSLQDSLQLQRSTCARLSDLKQSVKVKQLLDSGQRKDGTDCDLSIEIKAATESLLTLNRQYSALLKHCGETLRLLIGLSRGYLYPGDRGLSPFALGTQTRSQGWHCEI